MSAKCIGWRDRVVLLHFTDAFLLSFFVFLSFFFEKKERKTKQNKASTMDSRLSFFFLFFWVFFLLGKRKNSKNITFYEIKCKEEGRIKLSKKENESCN